VVALSGIGVAGTVLLGAGLGVPTWGALDGTVVGDGRVVCAAGDGSLAAVVGRVLAVGGIAVVVGEGGVQPGGTAPDLLPEAKGIIKPTIRANVRVMTVSTIFKER
jgi:PPE-repeat protein